MPACRTLHTAFLAATLFVAGPLAAAEKPPANAPLPGVKDNYRIVKPAPEPDDAAPSGTRKFGRWDVTISGTVTVDITSGKLPLPRN